MSSVLIGSPHLILHTCSLSLAFQPSLSALYTNVLLLQRQETIADQE